MGSRVEIRGRDGSDPGRVLITKNEAKISLAMMSSSFSVGPESLGGNGGGVMIRGDHRGITGGIVVRAGGLLSIMIIMKQ